MQPVVTKLRSDKSDTSSTLRCTHEEQWPPVHVKLDQSIDQATDT